jgi:hypothetical protein
MVVLYPRASSEALEVIVFDFVYHRIVCFVVGRLSLDLACEKYGSSSRKILLYPGDLGQKSLRHLPRRQIFRYSTAYSQAERSLGL